MSRIANPKKTGIVRDKSTGTKRNRAICALLEGNLLRPPGRFMTANVKANEASEITLTA